MTTDQLRRLITARPFQPFTVHMADGRQVRVNHPETIAYDGGRIAVVVQGDEAEIIDLLLVPSLSVAAGDGNPVG
jgi:hypothetical protein